MLQVEWIRVTWGIVKMKIPEQREILMNWL